MAESKENMYEISPSEVAELTAELTSLSKKAAIDHFRYGPAGLIPGTMGFTSDVDIRISRITPDGNSAVYFVLPANMYLLTTEKDMAGSLENLKEIDGDLRSTVYLYSLVAELPDDGSVITETEVKEDGRTVVHAKSGTDGKAVQLRANVKPVGVDGDRPVSVLEACLWAAIGDVRASGDEDKAAKLTTVALLITSSVAEAIPWPPENAEPALPKQDTKKPKTHIQPISKVARKLIGAENGTSYLVNSTGDNEAKQSVLTFLSLSYDGDDLEISRPLTGYDEEIHNAVATLYVAGNRTFTARQVYQTITGSKTNPKKEKLAEIEASLDKQRRTFVTLDWSKELRGKTAEIDGETITADQCHLETYMLDADKTRIKTAKGTVVNGYVLARPPILYQHARTTKQLISYPQALLEATATVASKTNTNMLMRSYLIMRIKTMTRPGAKLVKQIRYDTVFEKAGANPKERKDKARLVKTIKKYLDAFVKEGLIAGWSEYEAKGSSHEKVGVTIETKPAKKRR